MGGGTSRSKEVYALQYAQSTDEVEHEEKAADKATKPLTRAFSITTTGMETAPPPVSARRLVRFSNRLPWLISDVRGKGGNMWNATISNFEMGRVLGRGLMGTVRLAKSKEYGGYVAVKIIKKEYVARHNDQRHVNNERKLMAILNSTFCSKLFSSFQDSKCIYFVMEFVPGGELFRRICKKKALRPQEARFYTVEVFSALEHIHSLGYVYRDLKPENVMIDCDGHAKLIDFGFATQPDPKTKLMKTTVGTPAYLSPELLNSKFTNGYSATVDWWALGIFLYELLTCQTPFSKNPKESHYDIYLRILNSKGVSFPRSLSDPLSRDIISRLCHPKIESRLCDPVAIKEHEYFDVDWAAVSSRRLVPPFVPKLRADTEGDDYYFDVDFGKESEEGLPVGGEGGGGTGSSSHKTAAAATAARVPPGGAGKLSGGGSQKSFKSPTAANANANANGDSESGSAAAGGSSSRLINQPSTRSLGGGRSGGNNKVDRERDREKQENHSIRSNTSSASGSPVPLVGIVSNRSISGVSVIKPLQKDNRGAGSKTKVNDGCYEFEGF